MAQLQESHDTTLQDYDVPYAHPQTHTTAWGLWPAGKVEIPRPVAMYVKVQGPKIPGALCLDCESPNTTLLKQSQINVFFFFLLFRYYLQPCQPC